MVIERRVPGRENVFKTEAHDRRPRSAKLPRPRGVEDADHEKPLPVLRQPKDGGINDLVLHIVARSSESGDKLLEEMLPAMANNFGDIFKEETQWLLDDNPANRNPE